MLASTHLDPVVGIDIHWEMIPAPPAPPIPTPIPNPFVGMIWDPMGLAVGILIDQVIGQLTGSPPTGAVIVNSLPATNTGTEATGFGHVLIPPGISWAPMPSVMPVIIPKEPPEEPDNPACPDDDAIVVTGSKTVHVMGTNFARLGDMAMSCSEPVRLPSSIIMAVPKGPPVLVGGPPHLDAWAAAGAFIRTQWVSHQLNNALSYLSSARLRNLLSRAVCFLTGHPVDVATGRVFTDHVDFDLPGPLPLKFERVYNSGFCERPGPLGYGWSHSLDQKVWEERGKVVYLSEDGREVVFDAFHLPGHRMQPGDELYYPIDRLTLKCLGERRWEIWDSRGIGHELGPVEGGDPGVARLLAKKTRDGHHRIELHYDERGCLSWVRDSGGRQIRFESDGAGRLVAIKLPVPKGDGHYVHSRFGYDAHGDLVAVSDPARNSWEFEYAGHLLTRETDRERLSFYFGYDGIGQDAWCVRTWGDGGIYDHQLTYDKKSKVTCVTNSLGHTTTYRMDLVGTVVEVIDPHGASTKYEYDPTSLQRTAEVDPLGHARRWSYDDRGNAIRVEKQDGAVTEIEVDPRFGTPTRALDPNGGEWRWDYDDFGRLRGHANPFGHWTRYEHEGGLVVRETTPGGAETTFDYDRSGNLVRVRNAGGGELKLEHDRLGRVTKRVDTCGRVERMQHDLVGNVVRWDEDGGAWSTFSYDNESNLTRMARPGGEVLFTYTGLHHPHERSEAGTTIRFHYDTEGRLTEVENEHREPYRFDLDARGLVQKETGFDDRSRTYTRDALGRVVRVDKPSGRSEERRYDAVGRVTDITHSDGSFERYRFRADGELVEATNQTAEVHLERDLMGRVVRELTRFGDGSERWVKSGYGPDGHRVRVESSDGHLHHIERDAAGDVLGVELSSLRWRADFERDPAGLEVSRRLPGGITARWERDAAGRPKTRTVTQGSGTVLAHQTYAWEDERRLRSVVDSREGETLFRYDARDRLVWAQLPWGEEQHRAMDAVGNIYRTPQRTDRTYGRGGQLLEADGTAYRHDGDGNLIERTDVLGDTTHYRWNGAGMLESATLPDSTEVTFEYDAFARRLGKAVSSSGGRPSREVRWTWDRHQPLTEMDSAEGKSTWIFEPDSFSPLAKVTPTHVWGVLTDPTGRPVELVRDDGEFSWCATSDVWGFENASAKTTAQPFRWPGQYEDLETGLLYNRYRYYDPSADRYLSPDPLRYAAGIALYSYAENVVAEIDPHGLHIASGLFTDSNGGSHDLGHFDSSGGIHSEPKILEAVPSAHRSGGHLEIASLGPRGDGSTAFFRNRNGRAYPAGPLPPCGPRSANCDALLHRFAQDHGVTITYRWNDNVQVYHPDGRVTRNGEPHRVCS